MQKIIDELKLADATLDADEYKTWCSVRLAIAQATDLLQKQLLQQTQEYLVDVVWTFPYAGRSPIIIKGTCMEEAVNDFYKCGGGEIMHIYDEAGSGSVADEFDAECNDCDWKGNKEDMADEVDADENMENVCPECGSSNVYYFR